MRITTLLFILLTGLSSFSQNWDWVNHIHGGGANHTFYDLEVSNDQQHVYGVGRLRGPGTFYGQDFNISPYHAGNRDIFLAKIDTAGNYEWVVTDGGLLSDYAEGVTTDEFDNVYVVGTTQDSAYFDNTGILSDADGDVFVAKYDSDGNFIWVKTLSGDAKDLAKEVACDKNGFIYVGGEQTGNFDYDLGTIVDAGYFLFKMDYDGNVIWCDGPQNVSASTASSIYTIEIFGGDIYYGGIIKQELNVDTIFVDAPGWGYAFFAKADTAGYTEWLTTAGNVYYADCQDIAVKDSFIYISGSYSGTAYFDTVTVVSQITGSGGQDEYDGRDAYVAKYNHDGTSCYWVRDKKSLKTDISYNLVVDKQDNIVVTGGYAQWNIYSATLSEGQLLVTAYNPDGDIVWEVAPQGINISEGFIIKQDSSNNYYVGGRLKSDHIFETTINLTLPGGKFSGLVGKLYPPFDFLDKTIQECSTDSVTMVIPDSYGSPLNYQWYQDGTMIPGSDSASCTFEINGIDSVYCVVWNNLKSDTSIYHITEFPLPIVDLGSDVQTCEDQIEINAGSGGEYYDWGSGFQQYDSLFLVTSTGTYLVEVMSSDSCVSIDSIFVELLDCTGIEDNYKSEVEIEFYNESNLLLVNSTSNPYELSIYNLEGKLINFISSEAGIQQYHLNLNPGLYLVVYSGIGGEAQSRKVKVH